MTASHLPQSDIRTRGRYTKCDCCGQRVIVRGGQVWDSRAYDASILVVSAERDGAIVEQLGRDDPRWGLAYVDLLRDYRKAR